jgi:hypothetical protein
MTQLDKLLDNDSCGKMVCPQIINFVQITDFVPACRIKEKKGCGKSDGRRNNDLIAN